MSFPIAAVIVLDILSAIVTMAMVFEFRHMFSKYDKLHAAFVGDESLHKRSKTPLVLIAYVFVSLALVLGTTILYLVQPHIL